MIGRGLLAKAVPVLAAASAALTACGSDEGPAAVGLYDRAPVPAVPDRTAAVDPDLTTVGVDGQYWAELTGWSDGDRPFLIFRVTQALFADTCIAQLGEGECPNELLIYVSGLITVAVVWLILQTKIDLGPLSALAGGAEPAAAAPQAFAFVEFPFLLTVRDSTVVEAQQIWVP